MNPHRPATQPRSQTLPELERLLSPGLIGRYSWFEVIEISASFDGKDFLNIFSIYVALDGLPPDEHKQVRFINGKDRKVNGVVNCSFGIARRHVTSEVLLKAAEHFDAQGKWQTGDTPLSHGQLAACAPAFYAPNGTQAVPLNRVLKNNFWNGSYIVELADASKAALKFLTQDQKAITALGAWVRKFLPIDIASVADRVGNIIIQLPVQSLSTSFHGTHQNEIGITIAWHPTVSPRRINGTIELNFDEAVVSYGQKELQEGVNLIASDSTNRPFRGFVWDMEKRALLAAYPSTIFIGGGGVSSMSSMGGLNRIFYETDSDGNHVRREVSLWSPERTWPTPGNSMQRPNGKWTDRRISDTEIQNLVKSKHFIQYGGVVRGGSEHARALADIRELLNAHGKHAAYLWDPYLSSTDVLATLLHSSYSDSDLRALTSTKAFERSDEGVPTSEEHIQPEAQHSNTTTSTRRQLWIKEQGDLLSQSIEGSPNMKLEFRVSFGPKGWPFHDRFLIFPQKGDETPKVWSLGASVNQLGTTHAIVQQVAHPQPVLDVFEELWARIETEEHLIWKSIK